MNISKERLARMIDCTLLKPDTTVNDIRHLCAEAKEYHFASVCVNPTYVKLAADLLRGSDVRVCTVIGFPLGANVSEVKVLETKNAVRDGAQEIDAVMNMGAFKSGDYEAVKRDVKAVVDAAGDAVVKVIIETGLLADKEKIKACQLAKEAGADFVKTCTGFHGKATAHDVKLMRKAFGKDVKASGGIRTYEEAVALIRAGATRIGTSAGVALVSGGNYTGRKFRTILVGEKVPHSEKYDIIEAGKKLKSMHMVVNSFGNLSVKVDDGMLITAGGAPLGDLKEDDIILVKAYNPEANIVRAVGPKEPSSETPLHYLIYQQFECHAIIHVHNDTLLAHRKELALPLAEYASYGTLELAMNALAALRKGSLIAMEKHGLLSIGKDLEEALDRISKAMASYYDY